MMRSIGWGLALALCLGLPRVGWALTGTANEIEVQDGTVGLVTPLGVPQGGTGNATLTDRAVLIGRGTAAVEFAVSGANDGEVLVDQGAGLNPAFGPVDLDNANAVTGTLDLPNGGTNQGTWAPDRCVRVNSAGTALEAASADCVSGVSASPALGFGTGMLLTNGGGAGVTVFAGLGTGVDPAESIVQVPMPASTLTNLRCVASAAPGVGETFTITARSGVCGAQVSSVTVECQISGAVATCGPDTDDLILAAENCVDFQIVSSTGAASAAIGCTIERS